MRLFLIAALVAAFSFSAYAADEVAINKGHNKVVNIHDDWYWPNVGTSDTTKEQPIACGLYEFFIDGTPANVDLKLQHGKTSGSLKDIDTDAMPDGVRFNSVSTYHTNVRLSEGFADIVFNSAGENGQNINIWMSRLEGCD